MSHLIQTIDYFIGQCEADLAEVSGMIREETNYEVNTVDSLSDYYDEYKHHLDNLQEIRKLLTNQQTVTHGSVYVEDHLMMNGVQ
jgi:hypothetical protein